ncbi:MAG: GNAT family N-acetyltransferase [Pseudomonadota bacterium]
MTYDVPFALDASLRLSGEQLDIRPLAETDWEALYAAASDPAIWAQHPASDRYLESVFRQYFDDAIASATAFVVVDRSSGSIIGSSRYHGYDADRSEIEIGWTFLTCDYWGGSVNRELKTLMLEYAFDFVDTVVFWVGDTNQRSRRALEKIGARQRDGLIERGGTPHVVYELRQSDLPLPGAGRRAR